MARNPGLAAKQARLLIDSLLEESIYDSPTADDLVESAASEDPTLSKMLFNRDLHDLVMSLPPEQRDKIGVHLVRIADRAELAVSRRRSEWEAVKAGAARLQAADATARAQEAEAALAETDVAFKVAQEMRRIVGQSGVHTEASPLIVAASPALPALTEAPIRRGKKKPLWSVVATEFISEKSRPALNHRPYDQQTVRQTEATLALWIEIIGDLPMDQYDGSNAQTFRNTMLRMPSSHGKSGTRVATRMLVPPLEAIRIADQKQKLIDAKNALLKPGEAKFESIPRLQMKTLKRHFSTLSQLWIYAQRSDYVSRDVNPYRGWDYQGVIRGAATRSEWSTEDLNRLLTSSWFSPAKAGGDNWWVTLIAMFSGMRVEEIIRLRAAYDVVNLGGVPCFKIQVHDDGWQPKTAASIRDVPIHTKLLELGLMQKLAEQQRSGERYLFSSFTGRASSDKLSAKFVSDFSRHKTSLGIDSDTTFHSFRHSVVTILRNTPLAAARESWIDAVLGHEGAPDEGDTQAKRKPRPKKSEGQTTYLGAIALENLAATVEAIRYPDDVDFSEIRPLYPT